MQNRIPYLEQICVQYHDLKMGTDMMRGYIYSCTRSCFDIKFGLYVFCVIRLSNRPAKMKLTTQAKYSFIIYGRTYSQTQYTITIPTVNSCEQICK